ncbi:hypothetical protein KKB28_06210, partial [bacterium]|nr:hypothetical protein [bacterium]
MLRFAEERNRDVRLALEAARLGGDVLLRFWRELRSSQIREKSRGDLVTQADIESEKAISDFLKRETPEWSLVAEEGTE